MKYKLIHKRFKKEINIGDTVITDDGEKYKVLDFEFPSPGKSGKLFVEQIPKDPNLTTRTFYPGVFDCEFVEENK